MFFKIYINQRQLRRCLSKFIYFFDFTSSKIFKTCYNYYLTQYLNYLQSLPDNSLFSVPIWQLLSEEIAQDYKTNFKLDFLKHPIIRRTMFLDFGGRLQANELDFLRTKFSPKKLKTLLKESPFGQPTITNFPFQTSHNSIHHLYHLAKFSEAASIDLTNIKKVVEWGGGYGNLARIFYKFNPELTYTLIDLPIFAFIQATYLACCFGQKKINLILKPGDQIITGQINIIPLNQTVITNLNFNQTDLFISTWALSESSETSQQFVENNHYFQAQHLLIGHQEKSADTPFSENIANHLSSYSIIHQEKIPLLKNNYYLFAERKSNL